MADAHYLRVRNKPVYTPQLLHLFGGSLYVLFNYCEHTTVTSFCTIWEVALSLQAILTLMFHHSSSILCGVDTFLLVELSDLGLHLAVRKVTRYALCYRNSCQPFVFLDVFAFFMYFMRYFLKIIYLSHIFLSIIFQELESCFDSFIHHLPS